MNASNLDMHQALGARYKTSAEADKITERLRQHLGLETKAQLARLAIGRSLAMGKLPDTMIDAQGRDIPASSLFTTENIGAWVGLILTQALDHEENAIHSMDALRLAIRAHWHRGALALWQDWKDSEENYGKFVETLIEHHTDMPEVSSSKPTHVRNPEDRIENEPEPAKDASANLVKALDRLGITVQVKQAIHGARITRYRVLLLNLHDFGKLQRSMPQLRLALNLDFLPTIAQGDEANTVFIDLPRPRVTWRTIDLEPLRAWARSGAHHATHV